ncbi:MAG TPA: 50S ribosomal protein L11 methyltransferase [Vicinamibacterales bacterium]|jgi:ribosomal protein L11 methyltransferase|nr:50S ribosomal protein L11 methyltransferase [Vicinamibacterales bacterium]
MYPAVDVRGADTGLLLALVDDFSPTAIEERDDAIRIFFSSASTRDDARTQLARQFDVASVDVPDEDWARRSQADLAPVTVGRITVFPDPTHPKSPIPNHLCIVIEPSMGFGTGHHVTTRLCLEALQTRDLRGATMLDVGTGSGILAIAAVRLGASRAIGIDDDADAIQAARENLALNPADGVTFEVGDLRSMPLPAADVVAANLTGALIVKAASVLRRATRAGGTLILSGLQIHERDEVLRAFRSPALTWEREEDGWIGLVVNHRASDPV